MFTCFAAASSDIPFEQAAVTEIRIFSICGEVGPNWRDLGAVLGLTSTCMDNIDVDNSKCHEKAREVLLKWKKKEGNGAKVGILINALKKMERKDAIEKLGM